MTVISSSCRLPACIHLDRLRQNVTLVKSRVPGHIRIMGVVKCDAYGHGLIPISRTLRQSGVEDLVVSGVSEGIVLRRSGIDCTILALTDPVYPCLQDILDHRLTITIADPGYADTLISYLMRKSEIFRVHVKIDTGLGRFGLSPDQVIGIMKKLNATPHIQVDGVYTHLARTFHNDAKSNAFTQKQIALFESILDRLEDAGLLPPVIHLGSSTGLLGFPGMICSGRLNALRIGSLFFGYTERDHEWEERPMPVAEVSTQILQVRDVTPGSNVGYHDFHRITQSGQVAVIHGGYDHGMHGDMETILNPVVNGAVARLIGKPSMANSLIDISGIPGVAVRDKVLLAGKDTDLSALAKGIGRGTWEILLPLLTNARKTYMDI